MDSAKTKSEVGDIFATSDSHARHGGVALLDDWAFTWWGHAEGFLQAGRIVAEYAANDTSTDRDRLAFPTVYLHRHALELRLKELIQDGWHYLGVDAQLPKGRNGHDLRHLWGLAKDVIRDCPVGVTQPYLDHADERIEQLAAVDPSSTSFRYPETQGGERPVPEELKTLDLSHFSRQVSEIVEQLDGWSTGIYEAAQARTEMAAEYAEESREIAAEMDAEMTAESRPED